MAEISYWEEQESSLSGVHWQLQDTTLLRVREILSRTDSGVPAELDQLTSDMTRLLSDARAITRSLSPAACLFKVCILTTHRC